MVIIIIPSNLGIGMLIVGVHFGAGKRHQRPETRPVCQHNCDVNNNTEIGCNCGASTMTPQSSDHHTDNRVNAFEKLKGRVLKFRC